MGFTDKEKSSNPIKIPDMSGFANDIAKQLGKSAGIAIPQVIKLGNPASTGANDSLYLESNPNYICYTTEGDETGGLGFIPKGVIPKQWQSPGKTLIIMRVGRHVVCLGVAAVADELYDEDSETLPDATPVTTSQLDFATLQPYVGTMYAVVKGAIYGDNAYADISTAAMDSSPLDTLSNPIDIPSTANVAIGVLVQLDPTTGVLSYKQSSEFDNSLTLSEAYLQGLLPLRDIGLKRTGYIKLSAGVASLDNGNVWTFPEFFPDIPAPDQLIFDDSTVLTIASGAITVDQSWHTIDTESAAASDNLDTINGCETGRFYLLQADNDARTVVIRPNFGNIFSFDGVPQVLDDNAKAALIFFDGTNVVLLGSIGLPMNMLAYGGPPDDDSFIPMQFSDGTMWRLKGTEIRGTLTYTIPTDTSVSFDANVQILFDNTTDIEVDISGLLLEGFVMKAYPLQAPTIQHKLVLPMGVTYDGVNSTANFLLATDILECISISSTRFKVLSGTVGVTFTP